MKAWLGRAQQKAAAKHAPVTMTQGSLRQVRAERAERGAKASER
jgi:hypothetical protein